MANKIRIESNPYEQNITYSRFDETSGEYITITQAESASSGLLNDEFKKCFFPFKAKEILCQILDEYGTNEELEIVFEGPNDEFEELKDVQNTDDEFKKVNISFGEKRLEDGRDVIREINDIFKEIKPIVEDCVNNNESINRNLEKFSDASNDLIPICVIGNTNMGKSTFINALLGAEYLPQDKNRCTAKIYKITKSPQEDRAKVKFDFDKEPISVIFKSSYEIKGQMPKDFENNLRKSLNEESGSNWSTRITKLLRFLNVYDENNNTQVISDLIELEVPFNSDVFQKSNNPFVIFDTPGSNYAGNKKDSELLKQQMKDLTNGLPIFVSDYGSLEINDNDALIDELQSFTELDQRFTLLIVNKADSAQLDYESWNRDEIDNILGENVPKKLANRGLQGIFFISSIMGLGYKTKRNFIDKPVYREFNKCEKTFDGSDKELLLELFKFNIMPDQLKHRFETEIPQDINQIYLNSGLFSIEKAIETYANKYSAYNKCQQSYLFLEEVFKITTKEIENQTKKINSSIDQLNSNFEKEKKELIERLEKTIDINKENYNSIRDKQIEVFRSQNKKETYFDKKILAGKEEEIYQEEETNRSVKDLGSKYEDVKKQRWITLKGDLGDAGLIFISVVKGDKSFSDGIEQLKKALNSYNDNTKKVNIEQQNLKENITQAENASYGKALSSFEKIYSEEAIKKQNDIFKQSEDFWQNKSNELKQELTDIVTKSNALDDAQKNRIQEIIATYEQIQLNTQTIKDKDNKQWKKRFTNRINVSKLSDYFNKVIKDSIDTLYKETQLNHKHIFEDWIDKLFDVIRDNIVEMNPTLKLYSDKITEYKKRRQQLENNLSQLVDITEVIKEKISWKE